MIDPDRKGRRPEVGLAGWREAVAMASTYPALGGLWEEGTRGSQPGKLPSREQARQGACRPSGQPCHLYNLGMRGDFLASPRVSPSPRPTAPVVSPEHGGMEGNDPGEALRKPYNRADALK